MLWIKDYTKIKEEMMDYFITNTTEEPACCSHFGCGRRLTRRERLFGDKCSQHGNNKILESKKVIASKN